MKLIKPFLLSLGIFLLPYAAVFAEEPNLDDVLFDYYIFKEPFTGDLGEIRKKRMLRALVVSSKTGFFIDKGKIKGLEVEYLTQYEKILNQGIKEESDKIHIVYIPVTFDRLIPDLIAGKGDIAAAPLTITDTRQSKVDFATPGNRFVNELVITNHKTDKLKTLDDLSGRTVYILKGSSYADHLQAINKQMTKKGLKPIKIKPAAEHLTSEDLLEMINSGVMDITVVDDYKAELWAKVLPNIRVRKDLVINSSGLQGWAVRKNNPELLASLNREAQKVKKGTLMGNMLFNRFYKDTRWIKNPADQSEQKKLSQFVHLFKKYGDQYGFDQYALIAQAYQESGLDNKKKSHRGAVGIMQILPSTAADPNINISNVRKLENNIHAGAKYLHFIRQRYFSDPEISPIDQMAFTWAAYNAGPAKVRKMRNLAMKMGLDQNRWFNNVEVAAGKVVGVETVRYVSNIYKYYVAYQLMDKADKKNMAYN